jgi:hypothetical protein
MLAKPNLTLLAHTEQQKKNVIKAQKQNCINLTTELFTWMHESQCYLHFDKIIIIIKKVGSRKQWV